MQDNLFDDLEKDWEADWHGMILKQMQEIKNER